MKATESVNIRKPVFKLTGKTAMTENCEVIQMNVNNISPLTNLIISECKYY